MRKCLVRTAARTAARAAARTGRVTASLAVSSCFGLCAPPPLESAVDAPITLEAVRALHAPPQVTVEVTRVTRPSGGGACGHSPLCLVLVPVMAYALLFPDQYDEAVVVSDGLETYRGSFTTDGDFLQARVTQGGVVRDLRQLRLEHLGRRVVIVGAEGPAGAPPQPVPVLPQVDLVSAYRAALTDEDDAEDRGRLLAEALTWLDAEAAPMVLERLAAGDEPDGAKAEVAAALCQGTAASPVLPRAVAALHANVGPLTAAAMLGCAASESSSYAGRVPPWIDDVQAKPFLAAVVAAQCVERGAVPSETEQAFERYVRLRRQDGSSLDAARAEVATCALAGARAALTLGLGDKPPEADLVAALDTRWGIPVVRGLDPGDAAHRRVLARALAVDSTGADAAEKAASAAASRPLEPVVTVALVQRIAQGFNGFLCSDHRARAQALAVLDTSRASGADLAAARAAAASLRGKGDEEGNASIEAAWLLMGEAPDVPRLVAPLGGREWPEGLVLVCDFEQVIGYALTLRGCRRSDLPAIKASGKVACAAR